MKFKCQSSVLQKGINIVERAISNRSNMPVMENIFFELSDSRLKLRGNDLELGIESSIPVDSVEASGTVLVKARTISDIVSKISNQDLSVSVDGQQKVLIAAESVDFDIHGTPVDEYPSFPTIESGVEFSIAVSQLKELIKYTIFSVSNDETKQFLNGVLVQYSEGTLRFVATDGYRLAVKEAEGISASQDFKVIVPFKAMNELSKIAQAGSDDADVLVTVSDNQVAFRIGDSVLISRVIQGQFPDYQQVIPKESAHQFTVSRRALQEACERASIIASVSHNVIRLSFEDESVMIQAQSPKLGDFKESVGIRRDKGQGEAKIAFNVKLVLDVLRTIEVDELTLAFNNELSPCISRPVGQEDYTYIIMPIRTGDYHASGD